MSTIDRNGLSRTTDASVLAERLQVDRGSIRARGRDPHAELKSKIHRACIARLGAAFMTLEGSDELGRRVREAVSEQLDAEESPLSPSDRAQLERQIADDILGYGPLEPFLHDESVTEVMVNAFDQVYVERGGKLEETDASFLDDSHLLRIIDRIVSQVGRRIDESSPMVDARLPDGSRVNAIIPPSRCAGRRSPSESSPGMRSPSSTSSGWERSRGREFLSRCVHGKLNILISGGTGTGKTTLLNAVSAHVPATSASSPSRTRRSFACSSGTSCGSSPVRRTSRARARCASATSSATRSGCGPTGSSSARSAARRRDMLQAMNTGHDGSLTTVHANSARDALHRLEMLVLMAGIELPVKVVREQIAGGSTCSFTSHDSSTARGR